MVPTSRLLECKFSERWDGLCAFLKAPMLDSHFPVTNEQATFGDRYQVMIGLAVQRAARTVLPLLGGVIIVDIAAWIGR